MSETRWASARNGLRYVVMRRKWSDAFGSAYEFARENGRVMRFWRKAAAQRYADQRNEEEATDEL